MKYLYLIIVIICWWAASCKEKYPLPNSIVNRNYLVVEGFIDNGNEPTLVRLTRTTKLDTLILQPEQNATVTVEGDNGETYGLSETESGLYSGGPFSLNNTVKYRLVIRTAGGTEYRSDFTEVKMTPPIDSINWIQGSNGVQIYANTHDPENNSKYYAWQFEETWDFYSYGYINYLFNDATGKMDRNPEPDRTYHCWQSAKSTNILIGSSARLSEDVIYQAPLVFIPDDSWKLDSKYSILVKQRVLEKGAYEFFERMKKNSEQLGSIFDPQPSSSGGNIRCITDPNELAIGYIYVSSVIEKRIFIDRSELTGWKYREYCELDTIPNIRDSLRFYFDVLKMGAMYEVYQGPMVIGYSASTKICMDCTLRGTNVKPDFWP